MEKPIQLTPAQKINLLLDPKGNWEAVSFNFDVTGRFGGTTAVVVKFVCASSGMEKLGVYKLEQMV